jgi:hypothetical protein
VEEIASQHGLCLGAQELLCSTSSSASFDAAERASSAIQPVRRTKIR